MRLKSLLFVAGAALTLGGAAIAQDHSAALGGSMGTQASATPRSVTADQASGAHHTPVAKAQRHHSARTRKPSMKPSASSPSGGATGSGDMTPSGNANPTNQH